MPSPFPGMDPYLEAHWGDVHSSLVIYAREFLQPRLPAELRARVEERIFVEAEESHTRTVYPDVRVYERVRPASQQPAAEFSDTATIAVAEPLVIPVDSEPKTERFIEIREARGGGRVITVIEFVSQSNKQRGKGRDQYLQKQDELYAARVNSVEIDLLRGGLYTLAVPEDFVPPEYRTPYRVCVWRAVQPLQYEVYRLPLRETLPAIKIPLRETDADVPLDLQALVNRSYLTGGYDDDIDYSQPPDPPLDRDDAAWTDEILKEQGLRP
jgi:hypothetical protein